MPVKSTMAPLLLDPIIQCSLRPLSVTGSMADLFGVAATAYVSISLIRIL